MKNNQKTNDIDIVTPIFEIFSEVLGMILELIKELGKLAFRKIFNKAPPLEKIERKSLEVKKMTNVKEALGIDTRTKKEMMLSDIESWL